MEIARDSVPKNMGNDQEEKMKDNVKKIADNKKTSQAASSSSDSSSDSDNEPEIVYDECVGASSSDEEPAPAAARGHVALFTWPCPRSYPRTLEDRQKLKQLKPEDVTKENQNDIMLNVAWLVFQTRLFNGWAKLYN